MHALRPPLLLAALTLGTTARAETPPLASPPPPAPTATTTTTTTSEDVAGVLAASRQLVVVQTPSWDDKVGRLQRYERHEGGWRAVGDGVDIVVGNAGLGWGIGLHGGGVGVNAPRKVEGDGRAPAGVFRLTRAFGKLSAPTSGLPSQKLTTGDVCVDDATHPAYNRILPAGTAKTWGSAEQMVRKDWLYDLVVVVDQNHGEGEGVVAGRGSCVFLHVWRKEKSGTAGCTAMDKGRLEELIAWLKADDAPLLVQLPRDVYANVRATWSLP